MWKSLHVQFFVTPWTVARQAPLSMTFPRQKYWSGLPCPSPEYLPYPGIEPGSPAIQAGSLPSEPPGKSNIGKWNAKVGSQEIPGVIGKFGLGVQKEAGQRLIEFCQENGLVIANTFFQQHKRRLYTQTSLDAQY